MQCVKNMSPHSNQGLQQIKCGAGHYCRAVARMCVCVCVFVCVHACVRVCVCVGGGASPCIWCVLAFSVMTPEHDDEIWTIMHTLQSHIYIFDGYPQTILSQDGRNWQVSVIWHDLWTRNEARLKLHRICHTASFQWKKSPCVANMVEITQPAPVI